MKIIQHPSSFEVVSDDGTTSKQFHFDENPTRRAISGKATRKRAFQEARAFAGKGCVVVDSGEPR